MKNKKKTILTSPGYEFEQNVADSFNEVFSFIDILGDEHRRLVNTNAILLHSMKALKNILISQSLMTEEDFEKQFTVAVNHTKNLRVSQSIEQYDNSKQLYHTFLIENVPPAHS